MKARSDLQGSFAPPPPANGGGNSPGRGVLIPLCEDEFGSHAVHRLCEPAHLLREYMQQCSFSAAMLAQIDPVAAAGYAKKAARIATVATLTQAAENRYHFTKEWKES